MYVCTLCSDTVYTRVMTLCNPCSGTVSTLYSNIMYMYSYTVHIPFTGTFTLCTLYSDTDSDTVYFIVCIDIARVHCIVTLYA